jgi:tRNA threonylcarbamoyl adenosine modification protein (Sua5/YciO/YrdC/YwlC family)
MRIITREEAESGKEKIIYDIKKGKVFVYPTDTIYGLGCNANDERAVLQLRKIKRKEDGPFSVIAPSKVWIKKNFVVNKQAVEWLDRLPGPYTLILKSKDSSKIAPSVNPGLDTVGVRMPYHWIQNLVEEMGVPIVTTSANLNGEAFMTSLEDLNSDIKNMVDFIIYEGEKQGNPSTLVHLDKEKVKIKKR